jgi:hypothetical protein
MIGAVILPPRSLVGCAELGVTVTVTGSADCDDPHAATDPPPSGHHHVEQPREPVEQPFPWKNSCSFGCTAIPLSFL